MQYLKELQKESLSGRQQWNGANHYREGYSDDILGNMFYLLARTYCGNEAFYSEAGSTYDREVELAKKFRTLVDIVQ